MGYRGAPPPAGGGGGGGGVWGLLNERKGLNRSILKFSALKIIIQTKSFYFSLKLTRTRTGSIKLIRNFQFV